VKAAPEVVRQLSRPYMRTVFYTYENVHSETEWQMKFHSQIKGRVKFHSETKGHVMFHSETEGPVKFHSKTKGHVMFQSETKECPRPRHSSGG
jgi:hypothetical protein